MAYNTKKSGPLLCGDKGLHGRLMDISTGVVTQANSNIDLPSTLSDEAKQYIQSKVQWTRETAVSYCQHMDTDFAIAEGGATGPTFRPEGLHHGFAVLAVAGRKKGEDDIEVLAQKVVLSRHADREMNMRLFADAAAKLCGEAMHVANPSQSLGMESTTNETESTTLFGNRHATTSFQFDRSSHLRDDESTMMEFYQRSGAMHVIVRGTSEVLFSTETQLALPTLQDISSDSAYTTMLETSQTSRDELLAKRTFLGRLGIDKTPLFALYLPESVDTNISQCYFANTRTRAPMLTPAHNELALTATAYINWKQTHQFCCACGSPMEYIHGGTCAKCTNSNGAYHLHWPRQDPSIIVLVTNPSSSHALLARSPRHPFFLYTALAGFVEAGETMEAAVTREVHEEAGVRVDGTSIDYVASQSWPFPRSCMIGFHAKSHLEGHHNGLSPIHIDPKELVDAQWFEKEVVYQAARSTDEFGAVMERQVVEEQLSKMKKDGGNEWTGKLLVPPKGVLARTLMDRWLESD